MIYKDKTQLTNKCAKIVELDGNDVRILDEAKLKNELGFLVILAADAVAIIMEHLMKAG